MNIQSALVRAMLEKWQSYHWTQQGFGFLRTKLGEVGRIHIWDGRLRTPLVSDIHAHPWPLKSTIISGELINQRFRVANYKNYPVRGPDGELMLPYLEQDIQTGEGGGLKNESMEVCLRSEPPEFYVPGMTYTQDSSEVHRSIPRDGTVTLLERPLGPPDESTVVYWPHGTNWVSAEPKVPPAYLVEQVISYALAVWNAA